MPTLIVLIGPTGVGKTELSLRLAETFQTSIVSADSRQLYAELKIGTAAPTPDQLKRVPHQLVGTLHLTDYYSAAQYETEALEILEKLFTQHEVVILTGGSGRAHLEVCDVGLYPTYDCGCRSGLPEEILVGWNYYSAVHRPSDSVESHSDELLFHVCDPVFCGSVL